MSKVLFVNGNLQGHFNPTIPVVEELVNRGEEVWYYCSEVFHQKVEVAGANMIPAGNTMEVFYTTYKPTGNHPFYMLIEYMVKYYEVLILDLLEQTQNHKFDYVIYDSILGAGYFLKEIMKIPMVCSNSSFVMRQLPIPEPMLVEGFHPQLDEYYRVLRNVCKQWQVKEPSVLEFFVNKGDLNLIYTAREINPGGEVFDPSYKFIGPSIKVRNEGMDFPFDQLEGKEIIYISLGTINTNFLDFYKICIEAFTDMDYLVVMSIGSKISVNELGSLPDNFIVSPYVPQLEVLQKTRIFISHGGFNSINEALYYGVPVIAIPMVNDQHMTAQQLVNLGVGITLKMNDINVNVIKEAVQQVTADTSYYKACSQISEALRNTEGYERAAEYIMQVGEK